MRLFKFLYKKILHRILHFYFEPGSEFQEVRHNRIQAQTTHYEYYTEVHIYVFYTPNCNKLGVAREQINKEG